MNIAERILTIRRRHGLTQAEFAEKIGVSDKAVSKWERGVSMPDLSVLTDISKLFSVSTDVLLGLREEDIDGESISLEKYLMGYYGFVVPDLHPSEEKVVLILMSPDPDDASHGIALSGKTGRAVYSFLFENDDFSYNSILKSGRLSVVYISSVPLVSPSGAIDALAGELEHTRLGAAAVNRFLLEKFSEKMKCLIDNDDITVIAIENEFVKRYLGWFIAGASIPVLEKMQRRILKGSLKILFVGPPRTWKRGEGKYDQAEFKQTIEYIK